MFKVDLHVHTILGGDSLIRPDELVPLARAVGLDAVCVTEHHAYGLSEPFEAVSRRTGFPIFRALEYTAQEGHLLVFGLKIGRGDLPPRLPIQRVADWVHLRGGLAVPAHPYQRGLLGGLLGDRVLKMKGLIALETVNASVTLEENRMAARAAKTLGLFGVGGSDAHGPTVLGRAYTLFPTRLRSEGELLESLRSGAYTACRHKDRPAKGQKAGGEREPAAAGSGAKT
jgi:hypothetical protein